MSSVGMNVAVGQASLGIGEVCTEWVERIIDVIPSARNRRESAGVFTVYDVFIRATILLAAFFAVSLILAFYSQGFLDWGSALVGLLGTVGLAVVGVASKLQIRS